MNIWRIYCEEDKYPGLWRRWNREQVVTVGWAPEAGYHLEGETKKGGWIKARNALKKIQAGDAIVVHLSKSRIGRIGKVIEKRVTDAEWDPIIPEGPNNHFGNQGRRILVRWDPVGPEDFDMVIHIPNKSIQGQRLTVSQLDEKKYRSIIKDCKNDTNWLRPSTFAYERALSDYIAAGPSRLEDGLVEYPYKKVREKVYKNKSRSDVLLQDSKEYPVVVECKQGRATLDNVRQLRRYMTLIRKETKKHVRGILVHGGARRLSEDVRKEVKKKQKDLPIELHRYILHVDFDPSE